MRFAHTLALLAGAAAGLICGGTAQAAGSSSLMAISADGRLLACTNRDSGTVTVVDLETHQKLREVPVGEKPEGIAFLGKSHRLAAAVYAEDKVVFLDADSGRILGETEVFDEPYGVVSNAAGDRVYVTLDYPGQVVEIDTETRQELRSFDAGQFTRGLALSSDGERLYVTEFYTGLVRALDVETGEAAGEWPGVSTDNMARQITLHPHRPKGYLTHIRSRVTASQGEGSIFPYVSVIDTDKPQAERRRKRFPMDAFRGNLATTNPWDLDVSPDGERLYVVFSGTDEMFACEVVDDDYREILPAGYIRLGRNPRAVRVAPDSKTFYVYNALDFNVVAYNAATLRPAATVEVTENPLSEDAWQGKVLFYSALPPMTGRRWVSCSSCHPDGAPDGRTWQQPEGLRNTQALAGLAWTHPLHWSADRDEVQDFEHTIRSQLMQGRGLIDGRPQPELGPPNKGLSDKLDALAAYTNSHKFTLSPHAKKGLGEAAQRGRELFFANETRCAECHKGPFYTDSQSGQKIIRHNVGTGKDDPTEKMGPEYDTPTLLGLYRTAPYLHHGRAETLEEVLTTHNRDDRHGRTSHLTSQQVADLVEFLKSLPYEDPEPQAKAAGMVKIEK